MLQNEISLVKDVITLLKFVSFDHRITPGRAVMSRRTKNLKQQTKKTAGEINQRGRSKKGDSEKSNRMVGVSII